MTAQQQAETAQQSETAQPQAQVAQPQAETAQPQAETAQPQAETAQPRAQAEPAADHASLSSLTLDARQLGDLELILSGAFAPLRGFLTRADLASVQASATLADGTPWPVAVTLDAAADAVDAGADRVLLADPEGTPLAVLTITERSALPETQDRVLLAGPVTAHRPPEHGSFRRLMISPEQARAEFGGN